MKDIEEVKNYLETVRTLRSALSLSLSELETVIDQHDDAIDNQFEGRMDCIASGGAQLTGLNGRLNDLIIKSNTAQRVLNVRITDFLTNRNN